jgi:hypothetical protein
LLKPVPIESLYDFIPFTLYFTNFRLNYQFHYIVYTITHYEMQGSFDEFMWRYSNLVNLIPNLVRFSIMAIFILSYLLQPLQRPIMILWARVIESDKPVFTLVFGGTAALAKAIQEIIKILW